MIHGLNTRQIARLSEFLANMAVAWFVAAFIEQSQLVNFVRYLFFGILSLMLSMYLIGEEVTDND